MSTFKKLAIGLAFSAFLFTPFAVTHAAYNTAANAQIQSQINALLEQLIIQLEAELAAIHANGNQYNPPTNPTNATASIDQNSLNASTGGKSAALVTLTGSAYNVYQIQISLDGADGGIGRTSAIVVNGRWSAVLTSVYPGSHSITVIDTDGGSSYAHTLTTGTLTVQGSSITNGYESASIDSGALTSTSYTPTISGYASGVSSVGIVIGDNGGKGFGSGSIPVTYPGNNTSGTGWWSVVVSPALTPQSNPYTIYVYAPDNTVLTTGQLTINSSAPTTGSNVYLLYVNGALANTVTGLSQTAALSNCALTESQNPSATIHCTYNGVDIYDHVGTGTNTQPSGGTTGTTGKADLTASISGPTTATVGQSVTVYGTATNSGTASTGANFNGVFVTNLNSSQTDWNTKNVVSLAALAPGQSENTSTSFSWSTPGTYQYAFCADSSTLWAGSISESNESNNCSNHQTIVVSGSNTGSATGSYILYVNGAFANSVTNISQAEALSNCQLTASQNPGASVSCTFNGTQIYSR